MANLTETAQWEDGIYQIETSDPVLGGPDGISNKQAKLLANRTSFLKQQTETGAQGLADHIAAADPHPQYAPEASPVFTGKPVGPTALVASNDTQLATTAFVKLALAALVNASPAALDTLKELADALGNDANFAATMTTALAGKQAKDSTLTNLSGKDVAGLLTYLGLKGAALLDVGTTAGTVAAGNDSRLVVALDRTRNLADLNDIPASRTSLGLKGGALLDVGSSTEVVAGTASKLVSIPALMALFDFGATAVNGSIRVPNRPGGIIFAWGTAPVGGDGTFTVTFSNPPFVIPQVASGQGSGAFAPDHVVVQNTTNTGFSTYNQGLARKYIAIGK